MRCSATRRWVPALSIAALAVTASAQELCTSCHGPGGNSPDPEVPSIAAQPKLFLENQLVVFREGLRPSPQMAPIVQGMPDAEITRLATHFSRLPSKAMDTGGDRKLSAHGRSRAAALRCGV